MLILAFIFQDCPADEDPFPYESGEDHHTDVGKDRTIMLMGSSAQKISVRLQPTVRHRGTQTEEGPSSPCLEALSPHKSRTQDGSPSPLLLRKRAYAKWENKDSVRKIREERRGSKQSTTEVEKVTSIHIVL